MVIQSLATHPLTYVTVSDLATYWMISRRQVYKHIEAGVLAAIRLGPRSYRIPTKAAADFERRMVLCQPPSDAAARLRGFPANVAPIRRR
jgi:excisionase family DNA binding protein